MEGPIWAAGAMSGTSLDGVDAALLKTDGVEIFEFGDSRFRAYSEAEREVLRSGLGKWPGEAGLEALSEQVETTHAVVLSQLSGAELVGFHGQTLAHEPLGRGTHQAGSGQVLADVLGLPVVWDFRSADVELGGEGAPLAPFFHFACARWIGAEAPMVFLNLGGVGNLTWVDPSKSGPEEEGAILAFDTGPGNALLDDLMQARLGLGRDEGGALAASGQADEALIAEIMTRGYFSRMPPKSLDRNDFEDVVERLSGMEDADAAATLAALTAASVADGISFCPIRPARVLVCGGGRHNRAIMRQLGARLDCPVEPVEAVGLDGDMIEAQCFAYLAVRVARGMATSGPSTTGVAALVGGGVLSRPQT